MTQNEKAVIVGCLLNGASPELIAATFGISEAYVELIWKEYCAAKKRPIEIRK